MFVIWVWVLGNKGGEKLEGFKIAFFINFKVVLVFINFYYEDINI